MQISQPNPIVPILKWQIAALLFLELGWILAASFAASDQKIRELVAQGSLQLMAAVALMRTAQKIEPNEISGAAVAATVPTVNSAAAYFDSRSHHNFRWTAVLFFISGLFMISASIPAKEDSQALQALGTLGLLGNIAAYSLALSQAYKIEEHYSDPQHLFKNKYFVYQKMLPPVSFGAAIAASIVALISLYSNAEGRKIATVFWDVLALAVMAAGIVFYVRRFYREQHPDSEQRRLVVH